MALYSYSLSLVSRLHDEAAWNDTDRSAVSGHAQYLRDLQERGIVLLAGRTDAPNDATRGIVILESSSADEARKVMDADPAVLGGIMEATLAPFRLAVGSAGRIAADLANATADAGDLAVTATEAGADASCPLDPPPFIPPREKLPFPIGLLLDLAESRIGRRLLGLRALAWYPKALIGAGLLEAFVAHDDKKASRRLLALVRLRVSYLASCPFCIDMNGSGFSEAGVAEAELAALRGEASPVSVGTFSEAELAALDFTDSVCTTPVRVSEETAARLLSAVGPRGFAIIAATAAQVNFWARLFQGLGAPPSGLAAFPRKLALESYANPLRKRKEG